MKLVIGNKNYSSWSLRPWLLLSFHRIHFEKIRVPLGLETTSGAIAQYSAAGKVPVLLDEDITVWDSLAICEYISEKYLNERGWPEDPKARAEARTCSAEMHSGFIHLREQLPMNCRAVGRKVASTPELERDVARIYSLWRALRAKHSHLGPWLFGEFSIANCMFAPVAFRFNTYGVFVSDICASYLSQLLGNEHMRTWLNQAQQESEIISANEAGV